MIVRSIQLLACILLIAITHASDLLFPNLPTSENELKELLTSLQSKNANANSPSAILTRLEIGAVKVGLGLWHSASGDYVTASMSINKESLSTSENSPRWETLVSLMSYSSTSLESLVKNLIMHPSHTLNYINPKKSVHPTYTLSIPFYLCQETGLPFFKWYPLYCKSPYAQILLININDLDENYLKEVGRKTCEDFFGWEEKSEQYYDPEKVKNTPVKVYERCINQIEEGIGLEIRSINNSKNYEKWQVGHFELEGRYEGVLEELEKVVEGVTSESLGMEGNVWRDNGSKPGEKRNQKTIYVDEMLINKRRCLLTTISTSLTSQNPKYMEVGFNAGHSSAMILSTFSDVRITAFDLCMHDYTVEAYEWLKGRYGGRIELICGASERTVEEWGGPTAVGRVQELQSYDAIFVDAGHLYFNALTDILQTSKFAKPGAIMIIDDCTTNLFNREDNGNLAEDNVYEYHVSLAFKHAVDGGVLVPVRGDVCGDADLCVAKVGRGHGGGEGRGGEL
ncbi:hypothetical protein TrLO_g12060 [Triparma laevis f. longispina]|uniref:Uncharacterized protein n=1 Tax=Triparma laevis f. longispina TaxID=1714387 RepID=A0A9W7ALB6_9STRA|nr:hypothetical protein TrLO_g12060 [Triparma laevis f. longispina]